MKHFTNIGNIIPMILGKEQCKAFMIKLFKNIDPFTHMRIAISLQKNLRDILCHVTTLQLKNRNVSNFLGDKQT
jgi:hypothetical protein